MTIRYQWYDHLIRRTEEGKKIIKEVERCLAEHDFEKFMKLKETLNSLNEKFLFLPSFGFINETDDIEIIDITIKENFDKITENQYECG